MSDLHQGEEYEEEEYDTEDGESEEYEDEESDLEIDTFYGVPKNVVYMGAAVLLVIVIAVGVIVTWKKKDVEAPSEDTENDFLDTTEVDIGLEDIYDDEEDTSYTDSDYDYYEEDEDVTIADISTEESEELRRLGYTGDEIQLALEWGLNYQALVDHATELRNEEAKEALQRMSDTAGPEFKEIMNYTYMGQADYVNPTGNRGDYEESRTTVKINSDYIKCPVKGNQLWLKCHIATDAYVWYQCSPVRWLALPDEGNIVLSIDFWLLNDNAYVVGISESDSSLDSIDASEHNIDEVTSDETQIEENDEQSENNEDAGDATFLTE